MIRPLRSGHLICQALLTLHPFYDIPQPERAPIKKAARSRIFNLQKGSHVKFKERFSGTLKELSGGIGWSLICLFYFIIGTVLAIPYNYLAGWDRSLLPILVIPLPAVALFLSVFYKMRKDDDPRIGPIFGLLFWSRLVYSLLPILGNGISILLKQTTYAAAGTFVFEHRYSGLFIAPWLVIVWLVAKACVRDKTKRKMNRNAPPPPSAPTGGSGPTTSVDASSDERTTTDHVLHLVST